MNKDNATLHVVCVGSCEVSRPIYGNLGDF